LGTRSFIFAEEGDDDRDLSDGREGMEVRENGCFGKKEVDVDVDVDVVDL
jgi:hypothetical protein